MRDHIDEIEKAIWEKPNTLENLISQVNKENQEFYDAAIKMHNNQALRELATNDWYGISLVRCKNRGDNSLFYGEKGFIADIPKCTDPGSYCESACFTSKYYGFAEKEGKLYAKGKSMLSLFPMLSLKKMESIIEDNIKSILDKKKD